MDPLKQRSDKGEPRRSGGIVFRNYMADASEAIGTVSGRQSGGLTYYQYSTGPFGTLISAVGRLSSRVPCRARIWKRK